MKLKNTPQFCSTIMHAWDRKKVLVRIAVDVIFFFNGVERPLCQTISLFRLRINGAGAVTDGGGGRAPHQRRPPTVKTVKYTGMRKYNP